MIEIDWDGLNSVPLATRDKILDKLKKVMTERFIIVKDRFGQRFQEMFGVPIDQFQYEFGFDVFRLIGFLMQRPEFWGICHAGQPGDKLILEILACEREGITVKN